MNVGPGARTGRELDGMRVWLAAALVWVAAQAGGAAAPGLVQGAGAGAGEAVYFESPEPLDGWLHARVVGPARITRGVPASFRVELRPVDYRSQPHRYAWHSESWIVNDPNLGLALLLPDVPHRVERRATLAGHRLDIGRNFVRQLGPWVRFERPHRPPREEVEFGMLLGLDAIQEYLAELVAGAAVGLRISLGLTFASAAEVIGGSVRQDEAIRRFSAAVHTHEVLELPAPDVDFVGADLGFTVTWQQEETTIPLGILVKADRRTRLGQHDARYFLVEIPISIGRPASSFSEASATAEPPDVEASAPRRSSSDGPFESPRIFTPASFSPTDGAIDLVFCIDTTGSMRDDIDAVKASASSIIDRISETSSSLRLAMVAYRDHGSDYVTKGYPFTSDRELMRRHILDLSIGQGGDPPEAVYEALLHAIEARDLGAWRTGARRIIILMGDAPPHTRRHTLEDVVKAARAADPAHVFPIIVAGADTATARAFSSIADRTGGVVGSTSRAADLPGELMKMVSVGARMADADVVDARVAEHMGEALEVELGADVAILPGAWVAFLSRTTPGLMIAEGVVTIAEGRRVIVELRALYGTEEITAEHALKIVPER